MPTRPGSEDDPVLCWFGVEYSMVFVRRPVILGDFGREIAVWHGTLGCFLSRVKLTWFQL